MMLNKPKSHLQTSRENRVSKASKRIHLSLYGPASIDLSVFVGCPLLEDDG